VNIYREDGISRRARVFSVCAPAGQPVARALLFHYVSCAPRTTCARARRTSNGHRLRRNFRRSRARMVVILIVPPPPPSAPVRNVGGKRSYDPAKSPGDHSCTSTTSISFVSSDHSSSSCNYCCFPQVDPDNVIATTKEGKTHHTVIICNARLAI